jgi:site-specific recombinase XerD
MKLEKWTVDPESAYAEWQREEAAGADRRPFAERSIVQHRAMFARFKRYLIAHRQTIATFGADHVDGFFTEISSGCAPGTTTQIRYLKLIERLTRHLAANEVRRDNPAAEMLTRLTWPDDEPVPIYLTLNDDRRLQEASRAPADATFKQIRNAAVVAIFLATGITSAECRRLRLSDLNLKGIRADVFVEKSGPRIARRVALEAFSPDILRAYYRARTELVCATDWLFIATAAGKPLKDDTLGQCVRGALSALHISAADMSPRLLRNTYGRRQIASGRTNEEASTLLGLSSHRTAVRLRQTLNLPIEPMP